MFKKIWNDPVWSKVIATGVIALIVAGATYFFDWWASIKSWFFLLIGFLASKSTMPTWVAGIMLICTSVALIIIFAVLFERFFSSNDETTWESYTKDNFYGLHWIWSYGRNGRIRDLHSCCSDCLYQIHPGASFDRYNQSPNLIFNCDSCGKNVGPLEGTVHSLENKIERFIQQKLRTGEWANVSAP